VSLVINLSSRGFLSKTKFRFRVKPPCYLKGQIFLFSCNGGYLKSHNRCIVTSVDVHLIAVTCLCSSNCDVSMPGSFQHYYFCEIVTLIYSSHCNVICSSLIVTLLCLIDCNITMFDRLQHYYV